MVGEIETAVAGQLRPTAIAGMAAARVHRGRSQPKLCGLSQNRTEKRCGIRGLKARERVATPRVTRTPLGLAIVRRALTNRVTTSFTPVRNEAYLTLK